MNEGLQKRKEEDSMNCRLGGITSVAEELMEQVMLEATSQASKEQEDN